MLNGSRLRNRLKILVFDGTGLWCCAKRLEQGRLAWPRGEGVHTVLRAEELSALLTGLDDGRSILRVDVPGTTTDRCGCTPGTARCPIAWLDTVSALGIIGWKRDRSIR